MLLFDPETAGQCATDLVPRPYQREAVEQTFKLFEAGEPGVMVRMPTGTGKTLVGSWIADEWCQRGDDNYVIVFAHERQLVWQFRQELEEVLGIEIGLEMATDGQVSFGPRAPKIIVASRQTCYKDASGHSRLFKFDWRKNWLVIMDEVHRWKWSMTSCQHIVEWFGQNENSRRLGLTATPKRGDGVSLRKLCPAVALDYPMFAIDGGPNAVDDGWIVPYDQRFITVEGLDWKNLREVSGDFRDDDLEAILMEQETLLSLIKPTVELVEGRPTLIFSPTVAMAKAVAHTINAMQAEFDCGGAEWLDGSVPDEARQETYKRFERGDFQFMSVCGLCKEGYNNRNVGAVAVYRPTKSESLAEQMKGRGCRPLRGVVDGLETAEERKAAISASDKPTCMIIDLVGISGLPPVATTAHLLASGKPDEVIERANRNAMDSDGPHDMAEEVRKAEREIEEEREQARLNREEEERRQREEYERRAKLQAEVKWSEQRVGPGEGGAMTRHTTKQGARMPFGKHKGKLVAELHTNYLATLEPHITTKWLRKAVQRELETRKSGGKVVASSQPNPNGAASEGQQRVLQKYGYSPNVSYREAARIISEKINPAIAEKSGK